MEGGASSSKAVFSACSKPGNTNSTDTTLNNLVAGIYVYRYQVTTSPSCAVSTQSIYIIKETKNCPIWCPVMQCQCYFTHGYCSLVITGNLDICKRTAGFISNKLFQYSHSCNLCTWYCSRNLCIQVEFTCQRNLQCELWRGSGNYWCAGCAITAGPNQSFCQGSVTSFAIGTTANPGQLPIHGLRKLCWAILLFLNPFSRERTMPEIIFIHSGQTQVVVKPLP